MALPGGFGYILADGDSGKRTHQFHQFLHQWPVSSVVSQPWTDLVQVSFHSYLQPFNEKELVKIFLFLGGRPKALAIFLWYHNFLINCQWFRQRKQNFKLLLKSDTWHEQNSHRQIYTKIITHESSPLHLSRSKSNIYESFHR